MLREYFKLLVNDFHTSLFWTGIIDKKEAGYSLIVYGAGLGAIYIILRVIAAVNHWEVIPIIFL